MAAKHRMCRSAITQSHQWDRKGGTYKDYDLPDRTLKNQAKFSTTRRLGSRQAGFRSIERLQTLQATCRESIDRPVWC